MLRLVFRLIGLAALAGAFAAAVIDAARTLADQRLELTPLGSTLAFVLRDKFAALPALVGRISPKLWDPFVISVLYVPTCLALAILGAALWAFTHKANGPAPIGGRR